jgi:hypothetical protein
MSYKDKAQNRQIIGLIVGVVSVPVLAWIFWCFCARRGLSSPRPTQTPGAAPAPVVAVPAQNQPVFDAFGP